MATKRMRGGVWSYIIKRKNILPRPIYLTFYDEKEGDAYIARLEKLLDKGIVPPEFLEERDSILNLEGLISAYAAAVSLPDSDKKLLGVSSKRIGNISLSSITYDWAEAWVMEMKRGFNLAPGTIRHHVGALARCLDWGMKKGSLQDNPLRSLPRRYATYTGHDTRVAAHRVDEHRDRRPSDSELKAIIRVLSGAKPKGRQRPLDLPYRAALVCMFDLALETAMRMREIYTLSIDQIDFGARTIYLDKTKNGDKRQVPLSSVAQESLKEYLDHVERGASGMGGFTSPNGLLFPWWNMNFDELNKVTSRLSRQWARIFSAAGCGDLRWHDLRHEATCRFYLRTELSDIQIAKITGHKDLKVLMRYANLRGSDLADKLW